MPSRRREQQILRAISKRLAEEDPDWVAQFGESPGRCGPTPSVALIELLAMTLWEPGSFPAALFGVGLIATPLCLTSMYVSDLAPWAVLVLTLAFALCLTPMYRYVAISERSPEDEQ